MSVGQDGSSGTTGTSTPESLDADAKLSPEAGGGAGAKDAGGGVGAVPLGTEKAGLPPLKSEGVAAKSGSLTDVKSETGTKPSGEARPLGASQAATPPLSTTQAIAGTAMLLGVLLIAFALKQKMGRRAAAKPVGTVGGAEQAELLRDIRELTDRLASDLDAKAERLERLLRAADDRIRVLEANAKETRLIEPKAEARRASPYDATHQDVYELADAGLGVIEIAQRLDRPTGQVELILNLRKGTVAL